MASINIKVMKRNIVLLLLAIFLVSCSDPVSSLYIDYTNNSSYDIKFMEARDIAFENGVITDCKYVNAYTIRSGETLTIGTDIRGEFTIPIEMLLLLEKSIYRIDFGDDVSINIVDAKLLDPSSYTLVKNKKNCREYTYTFTDADYQYALENGQKLEY